MKIVTSRFNQTLTQLKHRCLTCALAIMFLGVIQTSSFANSLDKRDTVASHAVFVQIMGSGFFYTLNYEQQISERVSLRCGAGYFGLGGFVHFSVLTAPVLANYNIDLGGGNRLQAGGGFTFFVGDHSFGGTIFSESGVGADPTVSISFRHQTDPKGFLIDFAFTPYYVMGQGLRPYGGLSLGYGW